MDSMFSFTLYAQGLGIVCIAAFGTWLLSLRKRNVAIVDSLWPLMFGLMACVWVMRVPLIGPRAVLTLAMVAIWALRLFFYITWRNFGHGEDRRYQAIRARNQPHFELKSLYLIFGTQVLLAWIISLPVFGSVLSLAKPLGIGDFAGAAVWLAGMVFETGGDWQLARFKADPANRNQVMDRGFWRYTRHPNYFGDFCVWWGLYLVAAFGGAWWSFIGPSVMSVLLMRVSGVTLLEKDIGERRPGYAEYIRRTNAFFPGKTKH
jgi:steroid 5-alpha reductase family enzyme